MTANAGHIFVSHSSDNRQLASELAGFLEVRGIRVWIAPRDVRPGMDYSEELQLAIEGCAAFVVLVTDMANKSPYVRAETEMAFSTHKPIFPLRIGDIQPAAGLALFLKIRHWTDAFGPSKTANLERLVRELKALGAAADPAGTSPPSPAAEAAAPPPPPEQRTAPPAPPPPPPPLPTTPEDEEKWRAAVGPNAEYYLARWRRMAESNSSISWNWPACLANLFWFAWRRMWLPMGLVIAAVLVLAVIGAAAPSLAMVTFLLNIAITFVTGAFGNHLYRQQTARLVAATEPLGREAQIEALRTRGGTSTPALVVSLVVAGLVALLLVLAAIGAALQQQEMINGSVVDPGEINGQVVDPYATEPGEVGGTVDTGDTGDKPVGDEPRP